MSVRSLESRWDEAYVEEEEGREVLSRLTHITVQVTQGRGDGCINLARRLVVLVAVIVDT